MPNTVISIENVSKSYQLGSINTGTFYGDLNRWWANLRGLPDPHLKIGEKDHGNRDGETLWALKDINFQAQQGEVLGIIGRNGAGKSTLLKILARVTAPTSGEVKVKGRVASLLEVGTGFHPELTGRENIYLNGAIMGMDRGEIQRKFDEIVDFSGVEKFIDTPVKRYSSGMYVRLAFAVAAHLEPEILIVDEVLAVGDVEFQEKCIGKMEKVAEGGRTVLIVSHSMSTVKALCTRATLLESGTIESIGPVDDVINKYISLAKIDAVEKILDGEQNSGSQQMRIKKIRLLNAFFNSFTVYWKQAISIAIEVEVLERIDEVAFGSGIRSIDGSHIFTVHHNVESSTPLWTFEPGKYSIEFELQNDLRPGYYKLHVGAHQRQMTSSNIFGLDAITFEVLDHSLEGKIPLQTDAGLVNGYSSWKTPKVLIAYDDNFLSSKARL